MERTILCCDTCGRPAVETVVINAGHGNLFKDLCQQHLTVVLDGARRPRRGRKAGTMLDSLTPPKRLGRPKGSKNKPRQATLFEGDTEGTEAPAETAA